MLSLASPAVLKYLFAPHVGLVHRGEPGPLPADAATVIAPAQQPPLSVVEPRPAPAKPVTLLGLATVAWGRYEHRRRPG